MFDPKSDEVLIWVDDFDGPDNTAPDLKKWGYNLGGGPDGWGNREFEFYTDSTHNAFITSDPDTNNGKALVIKAIQEENGQDCWYGPCKYTSARLTTRDKFTFQYGRVEVRAKLPFGQGIWPAVWTLGDNLNTVGWPQCGEMDIIEMVGKQPGTIHGTIHGPGYAGGEGPTTAYTLPNGEILNRAYHIFSIDWQPSKIEWFFDGHLYTSRTPDDVQGHQWVFDHPFYLLMNLAVGGIWPGSPDETTVFPQELRLDYVHVYKGTKHG